MINIFKNNYSKWIPLSSYESSGNLYVIFVRKNFRTGMMSFRTKILNRPFTSVTNLLHGQIDIGEQWRKICEVDKQKNDQQQNN